jgi:hypothetical protein
MKAFARAIAAVFMVLGVIIIMIGIGVVVSGLSAGAPASPSFPGVVGDLTGLTLVIRLMVGGAIGFQGLLLSAIGEVLWLLSAIAQETERTSEYMEFLARRLDGQNQ